MENEIDLHDISVRYKDMTAYEMLYELCLSCGLQNVLKTIGEIAQQRIKEAYSSDDRHKFIVGNE
jgi:hypothetical protein